MFADWIGVGGGAVPVPVARDTEPPTVKYASGTVAP
jgi:hypothetical protein